MHYYFEIKMYQNSPDKITSEHVCVSKCLKTYI